MKMVQNPNLTGCFIEPIFSIVKELQKIPQECNKNMGIILNFLLLLKNL